MLQWKLDPGVGIGPLNLGMTRADVAKLNSEIGEPRPPKEMYGILFEDRPGGILTQYMGEVLVSINICPLNDGVVSVTCGGLDMFDSDARIALKLLERMNGDTDVLVFERDTYFDNIKVVTTGYYDYFADEYFSKSAGDVDARHVAVYLPEYAAEELAMAKRISLP